MACILISHLFQLKDVWDKYQAEITTMGVRYSNENIDEKLLPCFTIYPLEAFKTKGFYYTRKMIEENSFSLSDIFDKGTRTMFNDTSQFWVRHFFR